MGLLRARRHDGATLRHSRILLVEDEALVAMLVEEELLDAGAEVIGPACSVAEALGLVEQAARDGGLHTAVLDINLAGESALPVADRLAALGVPFVFATGYGAECDRGPHRAAPVLTKPFDIAQLAERVARCIASQA